MSTNNLRFCAWNIHGYYSREIGTKFSDRDFLNMAKDVDFLGVTETHMNEDNMENLCIPGFECLDFKNKNKNPKSKTSPGGIAVFVRPHLTKLFAKVKTKDENAIWTMIKKEVSGEKDDIYIATCYLNPSQPNVYQNNIQNLIEDILFFKKKGRVMINGDLNARTGNISDTIPFNKYDNEDTPVSQIPPYRNSQDKTVNERGKSMLEMCKALDLCIVNGRKLGDPFGNFTCFQWNGQSVADYLLTSFDLFDQISVFRVGDFIPWMSDHCPIFFDLNIKINASKSTTESPMFQAPKHFVWSIEGISKFKDGLKTSENQNRLNSILSLDDSDPNQIVDSISDLLIEVAEKAKIRRAKGKPREQGNPPWFDVECCKLKDEINALGKIVKSHPNSEDYKKQLTELKRNLKKSVKRKKAHYKNVLVQRMEWSRKDSKAFWKILDKFEKRKDDSIFKECISGDRWVNHYKSILQNQNGKVQLPKNTSAEGPLDDEISEEELTLCAYILKSNKATGYDCISNEMISCLLEVNSGAIKKLFNALLKFPSVINKWQTSLISTIHKKGSKLDPDNYRGISLLSCFAKYFLAVMNQRLLKFVIDRGILSKSQLGFLPGNRTSDALLILNNLIEYYCQKRSSYIFGCFVDFSKAFDSIPREVLFQKLLKHNITGKFYDCLVNLYTDDKLCIKVNNHMTTSFTANQGVKQGCILSPLLFNIFLSDLQEQLEKAENKPLLLTRNERIGCLIWADDILILSETEKGLQDMLNELGAYTGLNGLNVNITKTKVMIFNKNGRHVRRNFFFKNTKLETVREYKYLGFLITPSGEIKSGLNDLKDRAMRAFMKIRQKLGIYFKKCPLVSIKLFDTLVKPILLYVSDFWGILKLPQNNPIECVHMSCLKQILGVQKQTTNAGVLLELGQVPLPLFAIRNAVKNWERIAIQGKANNLVKKCYDNGIPQNHMWPSRIRMTLSQIGMSDSFQGPATSASGPVHIKAFQRLQDIFHQDTLANIKSNHSKLRTYSLFKTGIGLEEYLNSIHNIDVRTTFTRFRLSNHSLMIEKGRHQKTDRNQRFCPFCPGMVEDEIHFLLECKCYDRHRTLFKEKINASTNFVIPRENTEFFIALMSNKNFVKLTAQYIFDISRIRDFLLQRHKNFI